MTGLVFPTLRQRCVPIQRRAFMTQHSYIIVHELCHLRRRDHSDAFWNEVDKVLPSFRERKEWLRRHGASLDV